MPEITGIFEEHPLLRFGLPLLVVWLGACVGSFLNVVIYRLPLGMSVHNPKRSFCPKCRRQIRLWENIPLLSWFLLRGKCKGCGQKIPFRYWLVEGLTAVLFLAVWIRYGWPESPVIWILVALMVAATFIDAEHLIIPHEITFGGLGVALLSTIIVPQVWNVNLWSIALREAVLGAILGYLCILGIVLLGKLIFGKLKWSSQEPQSWSISQPDEKLPPLLKLGVQEHYWDDLFFRKSDVLKISVTEVSLNGKKLGKGLMEVRSETFSFQPEGASPDKLQTWPIEKVQNVEGKATQASIPREAMGMGDATFMMMIGAFLGWKAILFSLLAGSMLGALIGGIPKLVGKHGIGSRLPFGPYLAAGALLWMFTGPELLRWYFDYAFPSVE